MAQKSNRPFIYLFRGGRDPLYEHTPQYVPLSGHDAHKQTAEHYAEEIRQRFFPKKPSRLGSTFWSPELAAGIGYAGKSGYVSVVKRPLKGLDVFNQETFTELAHHTGNIEYAKDYWKGSGRRTDSIQELRNSFGYKYGDEVLLPGKVATEKLYQVFGDPDASNTRKFKLVEVGKTPSPLAQAVHAKYLAGEARLDAVHKQISEIYKRKDLVQEQWQKLWRLGAQESLGGKEVRRQLDELEAEASKLYDKTYEIKREIDESWLTAEELKKRREQEAESERIRKQHELEWQKQKEQQELKKRADELAAKAEAEKQRQLARQELHETQNRVREIQQTEAWKAKQAAIKARLEASYKAEQEQAKAAKVLEGLKQAQAAQEAKRQEAIAAAKAAAIPPKPLLKTPPPKPKPPPKPPAPPRAVRPPVHSSSKLPSNTLIFDIEAGGLSGYRSSVYSIAYQDLMGTGEEYYAYPEHGTQISEWSKNKVWNRIAAKKNINIQTEQEILGRFLNVLEKHAEKPGATISGWNIGYQALVQNPDDMRMRGYDISMLMTRARRHGLEERYTRALSRLQVRDVGQEWAARIAEIVSKPQYEGRVDPKLYESATGYQKALYSAGMEGTSFQARARWASTSGTKVAGWSQEITHFLKTGQKYEAHGAMEDVTALRKMLSFDKIENEEEFVERWNRAALTDKLVKQARSTTKGTTLQEIQDYARKAGLQVEGKGGLTEKIEELARASGANLEDVAMGRGMPERWSKVVGRTMSARPSASSFGRFADEALTHANGILSHVMQHRVGYGIAVGAVGLWAIGPLSLFSGKDDAHNTIEGMRHGGMAERLRKSMTDFGSGYQGVAGAIKRWYVDKDEEEREKNRKTVKEKAPTPRAQHAQVHAGRGKAYWITRTHTRPTRISGKDDAYNTITGMPEKGMAQAGRKRLTDFGSGYQGPNPWLQPDYNEKQEVARYKLMRASQLGKSVSEMVAYFTTKDNASEYLMATASAGTALHLIEETRKQQSGEAEAVEEFVYDPIYKVTGHVDLTRADSGAPVDIKSLAPERMERIRTQGAFPKHVSQINFYMAMLDQDKGYLEYVNRENRDDRQIIEVPFSQSRLDEDLARLARARQIVEEGIASGKWKEDELPKSASLETLRAQAEEEKGTLEKNSGRMDYLEKVYAEEMEYFHGLDAQRRKKKGASYAPRFSGKDDAYNTIEGLKHGGMAEQMRRSMTDFGSGWVGDVAKFAFLQADHVAIAAYGMGNRVSGSDDDYNTIEGMPHGWFGQWRRQNTDFGSGFLRFLSPSFWRSVKTGLQESTHYAALAEESSLRSFLKIDPREFEDVLSMADIPKALKGAYNPRNPSELLPQIRRARANLPPIGTSSEARDLLRRQGWIKSDPSRNWELNLQQLRSGALSPPENEFRVVSQGVVQSPQQIPARPTIPNMPKGWQRVPTKPIPKIQEAYGEFQGIQETSNYPGGSTQKLKDNGWKSKFDLGFVRVLTEGTTRRPKRLADGVIPKLQEAFGEFTGMPHTSAITVSGRRRKGFSSKAILGQIVKSIENEEWRIVKQLGKGGMGEVYEAHNIATGAKAAYKRALEGKTGFFEKVNPGGPMMQPRATTRPVDPELLKDPEIRDIIGNQRFSMNPELMSPAHKAEFISNAPGLQALSTTMQEEAQRFTPGFRSIQYEAAMHRKAYIAAPDLVPAYLGTTQEGFFQELMARPVALEETAEAVQFSKNALKELADKGVFHFDPSRTNMMVDQSGQMKLTDFGVSVEASKIANKPAAQAVWKSLTSEGITQSEIAEAKYFNKWYPEYAPPPTGPSTGVHEFKPMSAGELNKLEEAGGFKPVNEGIKPPPLPPRIQPPPLPKRKMTPEARGAYHRDAVRNGFASARSPSKPRTP